eukprot:12845819-Prorocentrum_lima.AAC.1
MRRSHQRRVPPLHPCTATHAALTHQHQPAPPKPKVHAQRATAPATEERGHSTRHPATRHCGAA